VPPRPLRSERVAHLRLPGILAAVGGRRDRYGRDERRTRQTAVEVAIDATGPGGGRFRDEELHLYTLDDSGKVTRMRRHVDTAKHIAANRGEDTTRG
jgi:hypothetical protein